MAEQHDESQKTEEPTQKRLADAREKGDGVKSQELSGLVSLFGATLVIMAFGAGLTRDLTGLMRPFVESPERIALDPAAALMLLRAVVADLARILIVPVLLLAFAGLAGHMIQQRPAFTLSRLEPKLSKLSPLAGVKRLFGPQALVTLVKNLAKLALVGAIAWAVLWPSRAKVAALITADPVSMLPAAQALAVQFLIAALALLVVVALLDYAWQYFDFMKRQRMTKQEVRDEHRQLEGDPHVKAKIRQLRQERARARMMAKVPDATVVVTNPTHYAVALSYESGKMAAPVCVAKGVDALALRIRAVAEDNDVPVVEDPPLARALYATVDLDEQIPPEHYKAVAGVIGYVLRLKRDVFGVRRTRGAGERKAMESRR